MTDIRDVEARAAANQANAVMGIYGISGTGKSSLVDTGAEECYETFGGISLCYAADLGGFGNKRLTLIRAGIMRVWDPRNHINAVETMELMSLGAWPERLVDPERGFAEPDVRLILPRRTVYDMYCPAGHLAYRFEHEGLMQRMQPTCPTCGLQTNLMNTTGVQKVVVRHPMFKRVGMRAYDSFTALNEWGMADLQDQSAKSLLPSTVGGGSVLGSADALRSGNMVFGASSKQQYGFMQNRTHGWLSNIRTIPDQIMPAIATFGVEQSKGDDESGGEMLYGPKISGNARTSALCGWLGHLLHATKEPNEAGVMVHRLWLSNHMGPARIPYVAKHRGVPLGIDYLEDTIGEPAWSTCSLKVFYRMQREQLAVLEAQAREKYPEAPGMWSGGGERGQEGDSDEVIAVPGGQSGGGAGQQQTAIGQGASATEPPSAVAVAVVGGRGRRRVSAGGGGTAAAPTPTVPVVSQETPSTPVAAAVVIPPPARAAVADVGPAAPSVVHQIIEQAAEETKSIVRQQLEASLAERSAVTAAPEQTVLPPVIAPPTVVAAVPNGGGVVRRRMARPPV